MFPDTAVVQPCVNCHNDHPDAPKKDWKLRDVMGATTWSYPDPAVSTEELLRIVAALRQGFREAYSAYLTKTETFSRHPEIGAKWPQDGYFLPSVEVFMAELDHRSSPQTLSAVLVEAVPRGPSGGETPERNRGVFEP